MNLVIVESPSKAKTINKYLGKGYDVIASKGHIVDLPKSKLSIDTENGFKPEYVITNQKSLQEIKKKFKTATKLILAVDLDREGEAIGWNIARELKLVDFDGKKIGKKPLERIVFNEISKEAIENAIKKGRDIDMNLVNAQQARRILDRIVGYKLSPLLWKKITFGLSAGRVQSVAVRLVVDREREREKFLSEEYWSINSLVTLKKIKSTEIKYFLSDQEKSNDVVDGLIPFDLFKINGKNPTLKNELDCRTVIDDIKSKEWKISAISSSQQTRYPKPPFITSTLQQSAVNLFGFSAKRTMIAAQKLYEQGLITYMRTDSVNISSGAIKNARDFILKNFGEKYLPLKEKYYSSGKNAQEAHECIRPVNFEKSSDNLKLDGDQKKIYDLIRNRALASQMSEAKYEINNVSVIIENKDQKYELKAMGKRILFDGFLKILREKSEDIILPDLEIGQIIFPKMINSYQHFTQPPARYSEATLIKKLEELGIGRPSTYASIISTIVQRKYVINENKYLRPTDVGQVVNSLLEKYFNEIVDYGFTADMEGDLDKIAEGKQDWRKMLDKFYSPFNKKIVSNDKKISRDEFTVLGESEKVCPECGKKMQIKLGRYGRFYSCIDYPKCKGILSYEVEGEDNSSVEEFDTSKYELPPKTEDGREYLLKKGRFGNFWAHPDYPKVKDAKPLQLKREEMIKAYGEIPHTKDGREFVLRSGRFGKFWAHPDYPDVKEIVKIKKLKKSKK